MRLNIGFRGEHSLSASLSGTRRSSLPFNDDLLLLAGVIGGGELAAMTTSASVAVQVESASPTPPSFLDGVPGSMDSASSTTANVGVISRGDGVGCHASAGRRFGRLLLARGTPNDGEGHL